jgi:hypothetical protein
VQDILQRERRGLDEEQQCLMEWGSLLKKRTTSEKERATEKWARLNKMETMLNQEEVTISLLDVEAQELMEKAKELYATAEARTDANLKTQEDLNGQVIGLAQREWMVVAQEEELERGWNELLSHEVDLNTRETALEANQKSLGDLCAEVLARELSVELKASQLAFREKELADKEKRLAEMQPQELAAARKRLEEL